jgi:hypothetical protein
MKKHWRFKTKKEFEKEHGPRWREAICWNYDGEMDYLCGTRVPPDVEKELRETGRANYQDWSIRRDNIVLDGKYRIKLSWGKTLESPVQIFFPDLLKLFPKRLKP